MTLVQKKFRDIPIGSFFLEDAKLSKDLKSFDTASFSIYQKTHEKDATLKWTNIPVDRMWVGFVKSMYHIEEPWFFEVRD